MFFVCGGISFRILAQTDSLAIDVKPRDGITNLKAITSCQRQIITAEQIRLSGYTQITDLLQLLDAATFIDNGKAYWNIQLNGTSNYQNPGIILMLNGQKIMYQGNLSLAMQQLGISIQEVESMQIIHTPDMYLGEYADKGIIHILTKKKFEGFSYRGFLGTGITGKDKELDGTELINYHTFGYAKKNFTSNFSIGIQQLNNSKQDYTSRFDLGYQSKKMLQQLQGNFAISDRNIYNNKFNLGRYNLGYINQYKTGVKSYLRANINLHSSGYTYQLGRYLSVNSNVFYQLNQPYKKDFIRFQIGFAHEYSHQETDYYLLNGDFKFQLFKPYLSFSHPLTRKSWISSDVQIITNQKNIAYKTSLSLYKRISIISNWSLVASYAERLNEEDLSTGFRYPSIYYFNYYTLEIFPSNGPNFINPYYKSNQFTFDANYAMNIGNNFKFYLTSGIKYLFNQPYYENGRIIYGIQQVSYVLPNFYHDMQTFNWVNRFNLHYDVLSNMFVDFNYLYTSQMKGDEIFMSTIPKHKTTFIINYKLPKQFHLWNRFFYQSATTNWNGYNYNDGNITYPATYASQFLWDLGFSRSFWDNALQINLTGRNILDNENPYGDFGHTSIILGIGLAIR